MKAINKDVNQLNISIKLKKDSVHKFIRKLDDSKANSGPYYVQIFDYLRETAHSIKYITEPVLSHIDNNHPPLGKKSQMELYDFSLEISEYINFLIYILKSGNFDNIKEATNKQQTLLEKEVALKKLMIKRIKKGDSGTKASMLYLNILNETRNMILQSGNTIKSYRDFFISFTK